MGLRYSGIRVTDLDRSVAFYVGLMHLKEIRRGRMRHGGIWVLLQDPRTHQRLELNWYPDGSPYAVPFEPGEGLDHIGFHVSDPKSTFERLVAAGARRALVPTDREGVRGVYYLKDPDGNWIELF
jgi:catechol 2,3-dioxygenase-like lactoylglutathione lyase family enzyme